MADESKAVDPGDLPDDGTEADESPDDGTEADEEAVAESGRGMRLLRSLVLLVVATMATLEISSLLCSVYSLSALERAFTNSPSSGLTLQAAQDHVVGLAMMSFREERGGSSEARSVHFAVFRWPSLFRVHSFEIEIEKIKFADATEAVILVRSQPYISPGTTDYQAPPREPDPDPQWLQVLQLDLEPDSKDKNRVERWQVERAIKNKKRDASLLVFFDKNDKNQDGVVTPGELGRSRGPEFFPLAQPADGGESKGAVER